MICHSLIALLAGLLERTAGRGGAIIGIHKAKLWRGL